MKKIILMAVLAFLFISCAKKSVDYVTLAGKIDNPVERKVSVFTQDRKEVKSIDLKDDNTFSDTLHVKKGYYWFMHGQERTKIYLKPGYDLKLYLDTKQFDETLKYEGKGARVNNYLAKKFLLKESFGSKTYYGYFAKLDEKDFISLADSLYKERMSLFKSFSSGMDKEFAFAESTDIEYQHLDQLANYQGMRGFVTKDYSFRVSKDYPDPYKNINFTDEKLLVSPYYVSFIDSYFKKITGKKMGKGKDYSLEYAKTIIDSVKNEKIRERLLYDVARVSIDYTKKLDEFYNTIKPYLTNSEHLKEITESYTKMKKLAKGNPSPEFELKDINGKTVTLKQFRGKLVYIDIWSPWCMPCVYEFPDLKKLQKDYKGKDIAFVSICENTSKEDWSNAVKKYDLKGIQLYAEDVNMKFLQDYMVSGVPRFILIDKEGKIIEANAKRPGYPELKKVINEYLSK